MSEPRFLKASEITENGPYLFRSCFGVIWTVYVGRNSGNLLVGHGGGCGQRLMNDGEWNGEFYGPLSNPWKANP